jgi:hypothetical protein
MARRRAWVVGLGVAALLVATGCCSIFGWSTLYSSRSPDGRGELRVEVRNCWADCTLRAVVQQGWTTVELAVRHDCDPNFAHAAWKGSRVAVFVDGFWCGQIRATHDVTTGHAFAFDEAREWLGASIVKAYAVTPAELAANHGDAFQWAVYPGDAKPRRSMEEFRRRFLK